jgi:hypothetical protein
MSGDANTQLIEQGELRALVEATRDDAPIAHVIRRPRALAQPHAHANARNPSALRGLVWVLGLAWLTRELVHFFF